MNRKTIVAPLAVVLLASLTAANPSLGQTTRTPVDVLEISCVQVPGMTWTSGEMLHMRGQMSQSTLYDPVTLEMVGTNFILGNANLNQETGNGVFFGTSSGLILSISATGTFDGPWTVQVRSGVLSGHAIAHGTGELEGQTMRVTLVNLDPAEAAAVLQQLAAQGRLPCPPEGISAVFRDTGAILVPNGK